MKIKIKYEDLETVAFAAGLQFAQIMSNNWHARVALAGHQRRLKSLMKEPLAKRRDLFVEFGDIVLRASRAYPAGRKVLDVNQDGMEPAKFAAWKDAIRKWREAEVEYDFDSGREDGKLEIELFKEDLAQFPPECLEVMVDYVVFKEAQGENPRKDRQQIAELKEKVDLLKAAMQGGE
jgi:hypothetical protein